MKYYHEKKDIEDMLNVSYEDFKKWENTGKQKDAYLRDAANKLVGAAEGMASNLLERPVTNYGEFERVFKSRLKAQELFSKLDKLHVFFYNGLLQEQSYAEMEYTYHKARKELLHFLSVVYKEGNQVQVKRNKLVEV